MHSDIKFKPLRMEMTSLGVNLNCASKKEHVPVIESFIWNIKEIVRSVQSVMPFKRVSKLVIVHLVTSAIFLDQFISPINT